MTFSPDDVLRRFHRALVREIQARNPEQLRSPFTVAEIYQNLVPYRTHRDEVGVEMNADYEHALLRLLAGEGEFLAIESRTARQEIREELDSPNPNTGLYRDFAAADVRLNPARIQEALDWLPGEVLAVGADVWGGPGNGEEEPRSVAAEPFGPGELVTEELDSEAVPFELSGHSGPSSGGAAWDGTVVGKGEATEKGGPVDVEKTGELVESPPAPDNCPWCREALPKRPVVRFCPFCGSNVRLIPCPECGEELELSWRFCIACGTEVAS
jgi:hypothetical protein